MSEALNSVIGFFERGGLFMWPLLICSIVALTTIILRGFALREKQVMPLVIESEIERLYQAELARCSGAESDIANFVAA